MTPSTPIESSTVMSTKKAVADIIIKAKSTTSMAIEKTKDHDHER